MKSHHFSMTSKHDSTSFHSLVFPCSSSVFQQCWKTFPDLSSWTIAVCPIFPSLPGSYFKSHHNLCQVCLVDLLQPALILDIIPCCTGPRQAPTSTATLVEELPFVIYPPSLLSLPFGYIGTSIMSNSWLFTQNCQGLAYHKYSKSFIEQVKRL